MCNEQLPMGPGKAVCFFNCKADHRTIRTELKAIRLMLEDPVGPRKVRQGPAKATLDLYEQRQNFNLPFGMKEFAKTEGALEMRFALKASVPGKKHEDAAGWLSGVMNLLYQSPVFREGEKFVGGIIHKVDGSANLFRVI